MLAVTSGLGLVALAWPLRTLIGRREALCYALLITLSPTFGYYSRSLRHDVPIAFFTMAALVAFLHFVRTGKRWQAYAAGVAIGFAAATKDDIYLTAVISRTRSGSSALVPNDETKGRLKERAIGWFREVTTWLGGAMDSAHDGRHRGTDDRARPLHVDSSPTRATGRDRARAPLLVGTARDEADRRPVVVLPAARDRLREPDLPTAGAMALEWIRDNPEDSHRHAIPRLDRDRVRLYAWAQEKVPWLLVPVLLPQAVLARAVRAGEPSAGSRFGRLHRAHALVLGRIETISTTRPHDGEAGNRAFEPLVYVQSTYDIRDVVAEVDQVRRSSAPASRRRFVVVGDATWPLSWYLRDYNVY